MSFCDDEQDVPSANLSAGPKPSQLLGKVERVRLAAYSKEKAPLEETRQRVMVELIDVSWGGERSGLDLVAVLDVSSSMEGEKLAKMKTAMHFVISKLSPIDRLSVVSFASTAKRLCPLRFMTEVARAELKGIVNDLAAGGSTNMSDGLQTGLDVLAGRRLSGGRAASVILMSDGHQDFNSDARLVKIGNVAVYTFGFGEDHDATVLETIASKSHGGTYNNARDVKNLTAPFSKILAGILSVVVQDLELTMWTLPGHSTIEKVDAGSYPQAADANARSRSVSFGDLYSGEVRKVIVDLLLPAVQREYRATAIIAQCSYSTQGKAFDTPRLSCFIRRTRSPVPVAEPPALKTELVRLHIVDDFRKASKTNNLGSAHGKLEEARNALDAEQPNPMIGMLKAQLDKFLKLTKWKVLLACLLAAIRSHDVQRTTTIDHIQDDGPFDTPRMRKYQEQANTFNDDPTVLPPSVEDDVKEEEKERPVPDQPRLERLVPDQRPRREPRIWGESRERRSSGWAWVMVILCTVLAIGVILAGAAVFAVFLLYKPKMPYLVVTDAQLGQLQYSQDGTIQSLQVSITILAENNNSKADASFSRVDLALAFHGADVALLRADPFVVARESSLPLQYNVVSAGPALDAAGMQSMDEALKAGVVPLDLFGKARTRWKVGIFVNLKFWTRISCRLRFFFPGNGTVMSTDRDRCRSRSP